MHVDAAEELDGARGVLQLDKGRLTLAAPGADAARHRVDVLGVGAVFEGGVAVAQLVDVGRDRAMLGIGVAARVDQRLTLGKAAAPLVGGRACQSLFRRGHKGLVGHG